MKKQQSQTAERRLLKAEEELRLWKAKYHTACDELEISEKRFDQFKQLSHTSRRIPLTTAVPSGESTAILTLSDWHLAETVDPTTINNLNEFNVEIGEKRVKKLFENTAMMIDVARGLTKIDELVVGCIGDFISGALHDDQKETDELSPTESIILCEDLLISGLRFLKKETKMKKVTVVTCYGNHGRTTVKPRASTSHKTSYEQLMYWHLAKTVPDMTWKVENSYHNLLEIYGRTYRFHHGNCIKYLGGVGGLQIPTMKAIADWDRTIPAYYDIFGHYHTTSFGRKYASNGSVVGYNRYAMENKCAYEEPSQSLIISSRKRGNILGTQIFCD